MKRNHLLTNILIILIGLSLSFSGCITYSKMNVDRNKIIDGKKKKISFEINVVRDFDRKIIKKIFRETGSKYKYSFIYYDVDEGEVINNYNDSERYAVLGNPKLIYPIEETQIIIYMGEKFSTLKKNYACLVGFSMFLIPLIVDDYKYITIDLIHKNKFMKRYKYKLNYFMVAHLLLLPATFISPIKGKTEKAMVEVFEKFILDAQKDNYL